MRLTRESAGFDYLSFRARRLVKGESFSDETGDNEMGLVMLGGRCAVESSAGSWSNIGGRAHVFSGMPTLCTCRSKRRSLCSQRLIVILPSVLAAPK